jgi:Domain of unknown function (DUF222)
MTHHPLWTCTRVVRLNLPDFESLGVSALKLSYRCARLRGVSTGDPGPAPQVLPHGLADMPPGPGLSAVLAGLDPRRLTGHQLVVVVAARNRQIAHEQGQLFVALRELGYAPPGQRDAVVRDREQNPFATVEAAFASTWTSYRSEQMMLLARFVQEQVPALGQELAAGRLDLDKVKIFHSMLVGVVDVEVMRRVVELALPGARSRTTAALRSRLQRLLTSMDPEALRKRRERDHDERFVARHVDSSGLAGLYGRFLDPAAATAAYDHVDAIAKATHTDGDPFRRSTDQLRADIFVNLLAGVDPTQARYAAPADRKGTISLHLNLATLAGTPACPDYPVPASMPAPASAPRFAHCAASQQPPAPPRARG